MSICATIEIYTSGGDENQNWKRAVEKVPMIRNQNKKSTWRQQSAWSQERHIKSEERSQQS
jgi:hypothetical protein